MELTKGQTGRRVCGTIVVAVGAVIGVEAIAAITAGFFSILNLLGAVLTILAGSFGVGSSSVKWIFAYIVASKISVLYLGFVTIGGFKLLLNYEDYSDSLHTHGTANPSRGTVILVLLVYLLGLFASIIGVYFAYFALFARKQTQDSFQFQQFNEPAGAVGPPPDYNYSNTGFVHTAQTQRNANGNKPVGVGGAPLSTATATRFP